MGMLPADVTSFVGRRQELQDVRGMLAAGRLVTLTGTGGVGKTRLALRAAARVQRTFPDGAWLVELAAVQDPALVAKTIGMTLGLRDAEEDPAGRLAEYLRDRALLLVIDNCEHLAAVCAALVARLLPVAPGIRVLATSRHVLGVDGEYVYRVPPLAVGTVRDLAAAEALDVVRLFKDRAAAASGGFTIHQQNWVQIVEMCRRLEGIPLAVELAAAWTRVLSVDDLLDRMGTLLTGPRAAGRSQTLTATLDWSHQLCAPNEQRLWAGLSVFAGGFDLSAAEAVCADGGIDAAEVPDLIAGLVDKSIVNPDRATTPTRFRLLETVREYGLRQLRAVGGEDAARIRHRDHYLRLAERWSAQWRRSIAQFDIQAEARSEHANLRAALGFSLGRRDQEATGLRLAVMLHFHWLFCGHAAEGRRWLEQALNLYPEPSRDRAKALGILAFALSLMGYGSATYSLAQEADAWAREHDDPDMLAHTVFSLGAYYFLTGDTEKASPLFREAITRFEALGEPSSFLLQIHAAVAQAELWQGHLAEGTAFAVRGLELCAGTDEQSARGGLLFARALGQWMQGSYEEAASDVTRAVRLAHAFNDVLGAVTWLELLCWTTAALGRLERAAELLGVAHRLWAMGGGQPLLGSLQMVDAHEACERDIIDALGHERYQAAFDRGAAASAGFDQAISYAVGTANDTPTTPGISAPPTGAEIPARWAPLSEREYQVAELVAEGLTNKDIALRLVISRRTAESHVVHILDKLGFNSRSQIATWLVSGRR